MERGRVEQLLAKAALVAYCKSLAFKSIVEALTDYGAYETAELKRTDRLRSTVERTLQRSGANKPENRIEASSLIEDFRAGAMIVGISGYGKTTLVTRLLREAIEARWRNKRTLLAFDLPLPDLAQLGIDIPEFYFGGSQRTAQASRHLL